MGGGKFGNMKVSLYLCGAFFIKKMQSVEIFAGIRQ